MSPMKTPLARILGAYGRARQRAGGGERPLHELPAIDVHGFDASTRAAYSMNTVAT